MSSDGSDSRQRYTDALDNLDYGHDHQGRRYVFVDDALDAVMAARDEELERLRLQARVGATDRRINFELRQEITRLQINAEKDVCSGCMQREEARDRALESARQVGVKYEAAKQRWYEMSDRAEDAEAVVARVRALADRLGQEGHPTHDHLCPDDIRRELLAALNDQETDCG